MVTSLKQERSNGDVTSTLLLINGRASSPTIFSKNFAAGSVLSILSTDTVYFTLPCFDTAVVEQNRPPDCRWPLNMCELGLDLCNDLTSWFSFHHFNTPVDESGQLISF